MNAGVEAIRICFPALARVHNGQPFVYGPADTQVTQAMTDYLLARNAKKGWAHPSNPKTNLISRVLKNTLLMRAMDGPP